MEKICDLHIHSRYSGGTSNLINIRKLAQNCRLKGIDIVGTGDCFHPLWLKEINLHLEEDSVGLLTFPKINKIKSGNYWFIPGYDGVYGKLQLGQTITHI